MARLGGQDGRLFDVKMTRPRSIGDDRRPTLGLILASPDQGCELKGQHPMVNLVATRLTESRVMGPYFGLVRDGRELPPGCR